MRAAVKELRSQALVRQSFNWPTRQRMLDPIEMKMLDQIWDRQTGQPGGSAKESPRSGREEIWYWHKPYLETAVRKAIECKDMRAMENFFHLAQACHDPYPAAFTLSVLNRLGLPAGIWQIAGRMEGFEFDLGGVRFNFIIQPSSFEDSIDIGVRVTKNDSFSPLTYWETPHVNDLHDRYFFGQYIFRNHYLKDFPSRWFSDDNSQGIGWIVVSDFSICKSGFDPRNKYLYVSEIQEDLSFVGEACRQRSLSADHRETVERLKLWKHAVISALEDLAVKSGYAGIVGKSEGGKHRHLYDGLFEKRVECDGSKAYKLVNHHLFRSNSMSA